MNTVTFTDREGKQVTIEGEVTWVGDRICLVLPAGSVLPDELRGRREVSLGYRQRDLMPRDGTVAFDRDSPAGRDLAAMLNTTQCWTGDADEHAERLRRVHAPAPSSARWEGSAPKRRRGR